MSVRDAAGDVYGLAVLGSGIAGLTTALHAARRGWAVVVLTKGELSHSATRYAQGGVAAALAPPDSPDLHFADTLAAGAGLCDPDAVRVLVGEGPDRVRELAALGARFDVTVDGGEHLLLAREGGHSLARVVHAGGDATGAEIERALVSAIAASGVEVREGWFARELLVAAGGCEGVTGLTADGAPEAVRARHTVLATGGAGQCFAVTTNPALSTGDGIALSLRAGVACADLEFVQFHPTALHHPSMPRPLLSEALRGEGAVLRDQDGNAFMAMVHPLADLAPRDAVSRAIHERMRAAGADHLWLDATAIEGFEQRFPTIWAACRAVGLDPTREWLPVAPAAHYLSGGVVTDLDGATTLARLWSCGEVACSGVHGANRLASNSLLDGLVFGRRVVEAIAAGKSEAEPTGAMRGVLDLPGQTGEPDPPLAGGGPGDPEPAPAAAVREAVQRTMSADCGVVRDAPGLEAARAGLHAVAQAARLADRDPASFEVLNVVRVAGAIVESAAARQESRGSHTRADFPETSEALRGRFVRRGAGPLRFVALAGGGRAGDAAGDGVGAAAGTPRREGVGGR